MITKTDQQALLSVQIKFPALKLESLEGIELYRKLIRNMEKQLATYKYVVERQNTSSSEGEEKVFQRKLSDYNQQKADERIGTTPSNPF